MNEPTTRQAVGDENDVLEGEDARAYVEGRVRSALGMSLDEFLAAAERDELPDHPMVPHLVLLTGAKPGAC